MINSLKYAKQLEEVGLTRAQAEAHVSIMTDVMETHFATKQDIKDLKTEMEFRFDLLTQDMNNRFERIQHVMTIKLGTIVSIAIGVAVTLAKLV